MSILMNLLSNSGYIIVNKEIIRRIGLHEAIILGEMCSEYTYWEKAKKLDNGFFFSTRENIEQNTGLSAYQQREPFKRLVEVGVILEMYKGMPQQKWYSLDMDKLYAILNGETDLTPSPKETKGQDIKKVDSKESKKLTPSNEESKEQDVKKLNTNNNNINNNNSNNKNNKKQYKEKVFLMEDEYKSLVNDYGEIKANDIIEELNLYKKSTGKYYYDDYSTIILWIKREEKRLKEQTSKFSNYKGREYPDGFFDSNRWYANLQDEIENDFDELYDN